MKKILAMILALTMCLSLCACGKENTEQVGETFNGFVEETQDPIVEEITNQLIGEWYYEISAPSDKTQKYCIAVFNEEGYCTTFNVFAYKSGHKVDNSLTGTYEVSENRIRRTTLDADGEVLGYLDFEPIYENGNLRLIQTGLGVECVKGDWLAYLDEHR